MHDKSNGFHEKNLIELCKKTHAIEILEGNERIFPTDTYLTALTDNQKSLLVSEGRQYSMKWLALSPQVD